MGKGKIKILAASDLHGDSKVTRKLALRAEKEKVDLVVLCGDLTGFNDGKDLIRPFKEKNQKVLILPGNWDSFATTDFLAQLYNVTNIHGYSAVYEGVGFFGAGSASTALGPRSGISENELWKTLEKAHSGLKGIEKKIMLTHMHPSGGISEQVGFKGSSSIVRAVEKFKPNLLLHGHIHETFGTEDKIGDTRVINVGPNGVVLEI
jgi:Icc-related predicted phosphoesterase